MATQSIGNANLNVGFEDVAYVSTESSGFADYSSSPPSTNDAIRHLSLKLGYKIDEKYLEDKAPHRGVEGTIQGRGSGEWSLETYLQPAAAAGAPGYLDSLIACLFPIGHQIAASAIQPSPTPTALQFDVDDATDMADDDLLLIPLAGGGRVVKISVSGDTLHVQPALPGAPAGTETTGAAYVYKLTSKPVGSLTIARKGSFFAEWSGGCWVNKLTLSFPSGSEPRVTWEGGYADKAYAHDDTLSADVTSTDNTTIALINAHKFRGSTTCPAYVRVGTEIMAITAVDYSGGTATVVRGAYSSTPATHAAGDAVTSYLPAPTYPINSPMTGLEGKLRIADSACAGADLHLTEATITIDNKCKAINGPFGTAIPQGYLTSEKREVTVKLGLYMTQAQAEYVGRAFARATVSNLILQCGNTAGNCVAVCLPAVHFPTPDIDVPTAEEIVVSLEGRALCSAIGNDELILAWL